MKTCATMGQATGTAAAYAVTHNLDPITLKDHPEAVWSIQQQLLRDDAYIIGIYNSDPRDYARRASVTASSAWSNATAENVISGQSRAVVSSTVDVTIGHGGGVPASQARAGTQRWVSSSLPASITLTLAQPVEVKQVQLVFDTGACSACRFCHLYRPPANVAHARVLDSFDHAVWNECVIL